MVWNERYLQQRTTVQFGGPSSPTPGTDMAPIEDEERMAQTIRPVKSLSQRVNTNRYMRYFSSVRSWSTI